MNGSTSTNALYNQWQAILAQGPAAWAQYGLYDPATGQWTARGQAIHTAFGQPATQSTQQRRGQSQPGDFTARLPPGDPNVDQGMVAQPYADPGYGMPNASVGNLNQSPGQTVGGYLPASTRRTY